MTWRNLDDIEKHGIIKLPGALTHVFFFKDGQSGSRDLQHASFLCCMFFTRKIRIFEVNFVSLTLRRLSCRIGQKKKKSQFEGNSSVSDFREKDLKARTFFKKESLKVADFVSLWGSSKFVEGYGKGLRSSASGETKSWTGFPFKQFISILTAE